MEKNSPPTFESRASKPTQILLKSRLPLFFGVLLLMFVGVVIWTVLARDNGISRVEAYTDVQGSAGLEAAIDYDCPDCAQKFDFNVYMFNENGQQVAVTRPNQDGRVQLALPEGEYSMLIGRRLGESGSLPQESVMLKDGKKLELKLQYRGVK